MQVEKLTQATQFSKSKHFLTLDALRGVAALSVVIFHSGTSRLPSGYLAVELFFILSGFVIAYSYEDRLLENMTTWEFMKRRFVRLYPMILAGSIFGVLHLLFRIVTHPELHYFAGELGRLFVLSVTMVPNLFGNVNQTSMYPLNLHAIYPLNAVLWSLFFELVANVAYGFIVKYLNDKILFALIVVSVAWFIAPGRFGGDLDSNFWLGFPRVGFCFFSGVLLFRLFRRDKLPKFSLGAIPLTFVLGFVFLLPDATIINRVYQFTSVIFVFPLAVLCGANHKPAKGEAKVSALLGALSYPIYLLHHPIVDFLSALSEKIELSGAGKISSTSMVIISLAITIILSYLVLRFYDEPVRRFLGRVMLRRKRIIPAT